MEVFNNSEDKWSFYCWQTLLFFSKWDSDMDMFLPSWCHGVPPKILYKIALAPRIFLLKRESISQSFSKKSIKKRKDNNGQSRFPNSPLTCKMQSWGEDLAFPRCCTHRHSHKSSLQSYRTHWLLCFLRDIFPPFLLLVILFFWKLFKACLLTHLQLKLVFIGRW